MDAATESPDDPEARFVVFDLETTGTNPERDRIISIGAVAVRGGEIWMGDVHESVLQVDALTPAILVHGITPHESHEGVPEENAIPPFLDYIGAAVLVGHHVAFDRTILRTAARRLGRDVPNAAVDTMKMTLALADAGAFGAEEINHIDLDHLCARFRITPHDRHTAPGDAFLTAQVFLRLHALCRKFNLPLSSIAETEE